ncbi:TPA: hypothetical protein F6W58_22710 [Serratia marcescens]|nr:hypothetical protein [Serratia marcescens]HAU4322285.1 hypothetical protein [Serratia marcescens]
MQKARFIEHLFITVLTSVGAGNVEQRMSIRIVELPVNSNYNWKAKFDGMKANNIKKMKEIQDENLRLKHRHVGLRQEFLALRVAIEKKHLNQIYSVIFSDS